MPGARVGGRRGRKKRRKGKTQEKECSCCSGQDIEQRRARRDGGGREADVQESEQAREEITVQIEKLWEREKRTERKDAF